MERTQSVTWGWLAFNALIIVGALRIVLNIVSGSGLICPLGVLILALGIIGLRIEALLHEIRRPRK